MEVKTILVPIYNSIRARNFFRTDVFPELAKDTSTRLVVLVPSYKKGYYEKEFGKENVIFESWNDTREPWLGRVLNSIAFNLLDTGTIRQKQWATYVKDKKLLKFTFRRLLTDIFGGIKFFRRLIRLLDNLVSLNVDIVSFLNKYNPDVVLVPDIIFTPDRLVLRAAKRKSYFTIGMLRSWDNLTSKGVIQILPNKLIVQTSIMKNEAVKLADMTEKDIAVLGIPQFDCYFKPISISRDDFFSRIGVNPSKRLVLCAPFFDVYTNESSIKIVKNLAGAIDDGKLPNDAHLLVRYRPESRDQEELGEELIKGPNITVSKPVSCFFRDSFGNFDYEFSKEDAYLLTGSIYFSDIVVNTISTLTIDAIALDKPVINIRFDADPDCPPERSVDLYSHFDHYLAVEKAGGVRLAHDMEELVENVSQYLENPELDKKGRETVRREQVEFMDGDSGKRTAEFIHSFLKQAGN